MSEIHRITLISDPTNEFPNNTNNSFKVRLPERTTLAGDRWHASLLSLCVPDHGQSNGVIASDPHTQVIKFNVTYTTRKYVIDRYRRVSFKTDDYTIELEDIMNANQSVTSGSRFWKRVMQEVHKKVMTKRVYEQDYALIYDADERPVVSVKKNWMGEHYVGQQPSDLTSDVMDQLFMVRNKRLYLSLLVEWQFNNMDAAFDKIVGTTRRTVMVYSDVVQSTVVG